VFGDLHGSLHSLLRALAHLVGAGKLRADLTVAAPRFVMVFCGDYVDRGYHGAEVLALVLALRARNPGRVFLAHGNHEDMWLNEGGGFLDELLAKFGAEVGVSPSDRGAALAAFAPVFAVYETLPQAVFVGVARRGGGGGAAAPAAAFVMAAHGGVVVRCRIRSAAVRGNPCHRCNAGGTANRTNSQRIQILEGHCTTGIGCQSVHVIQGARSQRE
jgi:hypothetical protein